MRIGQRNDILGIGDEALEEVGRMDALTRSLLDLSRLEAFETEIHFKDVDLASLLRIAASAFFRSAISVFRLSL